MNTLLVEKGLYERMVAEGVTSAASGQARTFGEELQERRKAAGFRAAGDLAKLIGVSPAELGRWERGDIRGSRVSFPDNPDQIIQLSQLLNWPLPDMQKAVAETRRLLSPGADGTTPELREIGILYAAGFKELSPRQQAKYVRLIQEDAQEYREEGEA